ncbi:MAG: hypothetical protein KAV40_01775 [Thermoplasmatales archaeon]|nr:hypothetical protein [Thermoplasmatales archaeon]
MEIEKRQILDGEQAPSMIIPSSPQIQKDYIPGITLNGETIQIPDGLDPMLLVKK